MQYLSVVLAAAMAVVSVQASPAPKAIPQGGVCFDNFDCFFSGFNCVNFQCVSPSASATATAAPTTAAGGFPGIPTNFQNVCFDNFDCFGKGSCVNGQCTGA